MQDRMIEIKNKSLLRFSREALAYYIEFTTMRLWPAKSVLADLKKIDDHFSYLRSTERNLARWKRVEEIQEIFRRDCDKKRKMSNRRHAQLLAELKSLFASLEKSYKKGKSNGRQVKNRMD